MKLITVFLFYISQHLNSLQPTFYITIKKKKNFGGIVGEKFTFQKFPVVYAILLEPPPRSQEKKFIKHLFVPSEFEVLALLLKNLEMK